MRSLGMIDMSGIGIVTVAAKADLWGFETCLGL
jgi:hypothetical protein